MAKVSKNAVRSTVLCSARGRWYDHSPDTQTFSTTFIIRQCISQQSIRISTPVSNHDRSDPKHATCNTTNAQHHQLPHQMHGCLLLGYRTVVASLSNSLYDTLTSHIELHTLDYTHWTTHHELHSARQTLNYALYNVYNMNYTLHDTHCSDCMTHTAVAVRHIVRNTLVSHNKH